MLEALVVGGVLVWAVVLYNRLVRLRHQVRAAWSDIDVQLKRRHDLIPKLVEAVRQYAAYEQATLQTVTELRSEARQAKGATRQGEAETALGAGVKKLMLLAEAYPELKANQNFMALQQQLTEVENHLQFARRYYNGAVRQLNTRIESVPDLLLARPFGFVAAEYFAKEMS